MARALDEIVVPVAGDDAWEQIETNIARGSLAAHCDADGVTTDFKPQWLSFAMRFGEGCASREAVPPHELSGRRDTLYFDQSKAQAAGVKVDDMPPRCVSNIVLSLEDCCKLWSSGTGGASMPAGAPARPAPASRRSLTIPWTRQARASAMRYSVQIGSAS